MTVSDVGREGVRLGSQLTGVAISVPVVAGFILLGAAVLVGRSLLDGGRKLLEAKSRAPEPRKFTGRDKTPLNLRAEAREE